jgi:hypothetical protein
MAARAGLRLAKAREERPQSQGRGRFRACKPSADSDYDERVCCLKASLFSEQLAGL